MNRQELGGESEVLTPLVLSTTLRIPVFLQVQGS